MYCIKDIKTKKWLVHRKINKNGRVVSTKESYISGRIYYTIAQAESDFERFKCGAQFKIVPVTVNRSSHDPHMYTIREIN